MALRLLLGLGLAACSFDPAGVDPGGGDPADASPPSSPDGEVTTPDGAAGQPDGRPPVDAFVPPPPPDAPPPPPPVCDPPRPDLVACWRFEATEHPLQPWDESWYGNHGTAVNVTWVAGHEGQAMSLGASSSVRVPDSASLDVSAQLTVDMWVRADAYPVGSGARAGLLDNNGQYGLFLLPAGQVRCTIGTTMVQGASVPIGAWTHLACTYDGATLRLYQDGVEGPSASWGGGLSTGGLDGIAIGQNSPSGDPFDGALDTVRVWSTALPAAEICAAAESC